MPSTDTVYEALVAGGFFLVLSVGFFVALFSLIAGSPKDKPPE